MLKNKRSRTEIYLIGAVLLVLVYLASIILGYLAIILILLLVYYCIKNSLAFKKQDLNMDSIFLKCFAAILIVSIFIPIWGGHSGFGHVVDGKLIITTHLHYLWETGHIH